MRLMLVREVIIRFEAFLFFTISLYIARRAHQAVAQIESDAIKVGLLNPESILSVMQLVRW
jgi:hypothetical protein